MITIFDGEEKYEVSVDDFVILGETHEGDIMLDLPEVEEIDVDWRICTRKAKMRYFELKRPNGGVYVHLYLPSQAAEDFAETLAKYFVLSKCTGMSFDLDISALYDVKVPPTDAELAKWKAAVREEYEAQKRDFREYVINESSRLVNLGEKVANL